MTNIKNKKGAMDVDFIGGQGPLTSKEESLLTAYFGRKKKAAHSVSSLKSKKQSPRTGANR